MPHLRLSELREMLAKHADKPDDTEVRIFIEHDGGDCDPSYAKLVATLWSDEDGEAYLGWMLRDSGSLE